MDERTEKSPEEIAAGLAERKRLEAVADIADEKVKMAIYGGAAVGIVGTLVILLAAWRENVALVIAGATIALVAFGVVSAAQAGKLFGRNVE